MRKSLFWILVIQMFACFVSADERPTIVAKKLTSPIKTDGALTESVWKDAAWFSDFRQGVPKHGEKSTERTEAAIFFDSEYIYVGLRCYQSEPERIVANQLMHREEMDQDDHVKIIFDTYQDQTREPCLPLTLLGPKKRGRLVDFAPII